MKDPAFLFYPNDWIGGTMGMSFEEKGAYLELLMMQFNCGHMTSHMIGQEVGQIWDAIKHKFDQDGNGLWYSVWLEKEQLARKDFTESRRNNLKGINQHSKKKAHMTSHMTSHMNNHMENENENRNTNKDLIKNSVEVFKNQFEDFRKKYPGTKRGLETEFQNFKKKHTDWKESLSKLLPAVAAQIADRERKATAQKEDRSIFIPSWKNMQTWINQRDWEIEVQAPAREILVIK